MNKSSSAETEVLEAFHSFWDAFKKRDIQVLGPLCHPGITFFGAGVREHASGIDEFKRLMAADAAKHPEPLSIEFLKTRIFARDPVAWVENEATIGLVRAGKVTEIPGGRMTTFFQYAQGSWLVAHIHASFAWSDHLDDETPPGGVQEGKRQELERLLAERTHQMEETASELRETQKALTETQQRLVLSEKMASIGQLTAGIAHEIKNPLNFVNNFAVLSADLVKELRDELDKEKEKIDAKSVAIIEDILKDLEQNVTKINEHGKRADSIVKGMLLHSRGKEGERLPTDLNALLNEYINLAYHGLRAQDPTFNVKIATDYDQSVGTLNVVPQDLSRVFLNIVNNGCYAANDKKKTAGAGFLPTISVRTRNLGTSIEIRIRDNGNGIPPQVKEKLFTPFFTTKPSGLGTGLGLSLSRDIITKGHHGEIRVDSKEGEYAEFIITLPRET